MAVVLANIVFFGQKDVLIASPVSVAKAFLSLCKEYDFWLTILVSLCRILAGYLFSVFFGILFAVFCYNNAFIHALLQPAIQTIKATPVVSFSILVLLWVKTDFVPIIISFLMVFPLIWTNTTIGIRQTQKQYLEMAKAYGFSSFKHFVISMCLLYFPIFFPPAMPVLVWLGKPALLPKSYVLLLFLWEKKIYETKIYLETPELFVWTICAIVFSIILEKLFLKLLYYFSKRIGISYEPKNNIAIS